jgi:hypothetical protein
VNSDHGSVIDCLRRHKLPIGEIRIRIQDAEILQLASSACSYCRSPDRAAQDACCRPDSRSSKSLGGPVSLSARGNLARNAFGAAFQAFEVAARAGAIRSSRAVAPALPSAVRFIYGRKFNPALLLRANVAVDCTSMWSAWGAGWQDLPSAHGRGIAYWQGTVWGRCPAGRVDTCLITEMALVFALGSLACY